MTVTLLSSPGPRPYAPPKRQTMAASALLHAALVGVAVYGARKAESVVETPDLRPLTFVMLPPPPEPVRPREPLRLPPVVREQPKPTEVVVPADVEPPPEPERLVTREEPPVVEARAEAPVKPERPQPVVKVGAFALDEPSPRTQELSRSVQPGGFDGPAARAPQMAASTTAVGAFERSTGAPRPGTDRPGIANAGFGMGVATGPPRPGGTVASAGFGTGAGTGTGTGPARPAGTVASGGFNLGAAEGRSRGPAQTVKATDFDTRAAQPSAAPAPKQAPLELPPEIVSKPIPVYTDEARSLGIEGEVLLEVEFAADGGIRVLKVVRALGHGLDEAATRAVQGIRFKPAQRNGQPIDFRTTVNIVFRLA